MKRRWRPAITLVCGVALFSLLTWIAPSPAFAVTFSTTGATGSADAGRLPGDGYVRVGADDTLSDNECAVTQLAYSGSGGVWEPAVESCADWVYTEYRTGTVVAFARVCRTGFGNCSQAVLVNS